MRLLARAHWGSHRSARVEDGDGRSVCPFGFQTSSPDLGHLLYSRWLSSRGRVLSSAPIAGPPSRMQPQLWLIRTAFWSLIWRVLKRLSAVWLEDVGAEFKNENFQLWRRKKTEILSFINARKDELQSCSLAVVLGVSGLRWVWTISLV